MNRPQIPASTLHRQATAADPATSAWVSANAGSGKTFVLARRVVRLLLAGTEPSRILCLTFTKAAAAEMATRVFETLGAWTGFDDEALAEELEDIEGRRPTAARIARARHLFAKALETPGGLKIQTIHAFCEALLHQFPLEANVAGHFTVLDDRLSAELLAEARARVLNAAENEPESALGQALSFLIGEMADLSVEGALKEMVGRRDAFLRWIVDYPSLEDGLADLARRFGVTPGEKVDDIEQEILDGSLFDDSAKAALADALSGGGVTDRRNAEAIRRVIGQDGAPFRDIWLEIFLTKSLEPRKSLATKAVAAVHPHLAALMGEEQARLLALLDRRRAVLTMEGTAAILRLADAMLGAYETEKTRRGLLDFEDLVVRAANLLSRSDAALWVQYKLDRGLDHILVDEAQDTSPRQWEVIRALAEEFFAGDGARDTARTIFAVGDEKQSIYSFQGAVPAHFARMRRHFQQQAAKAATSFEAVDLTLSFRSTPDVLGAVDKVFADPSARKGLSQDGDAPVHEAIRRNDPGLVEIWPLEAEEEVEASDDWTAPIDRVSASSPMMRVARRIAQAVDEWCTSGAATAGDVLVLVRKRGPFVEALTREMKRLGVPVAGSDRLVLSEHIAVLDLVALGRFLLLPEDDLSLAAVLKSPLFGLDDDALFEIARDTPEQPRAGTLWQSLLRHASANERWDKIREQLETWRRRADFMPPFEFYSRLLGADGGRGRFRSRFGDEVDDILDEFLALTIVFEQTGTPGLEGFLAWLAAAPTEIKRELSSAEGVVRIMTVHGAKGLEAPVVILADPGAAPVSARHDPTMLEFALGSDEDRPPALVWLPGKAGRTAWHEEALADLRGKAEEEYRRLLYVAMTRAKDRLVVCGWTGKTAPREDTWYALVNRALAGDSTEEFSADGSLSRLLWRREGQKAVVPIVAEGSGKTEATRSIDRPAWLDRPASAPVRQRRLQPSKAFEAMEAKEGVEALSGAAMLGAVRGPSDWALERGRLVHRMLEVLPEVSPEMRIEAADRFLNRALPSAFAGEKDGVLAEVLAILADARFAEVFSARARAEVPIVGQMQAPDGEIVAVSGQIDRLCVTEEEVLIVDYKTNRLLPADIDSVPLDYVTQLGVYRHLLKGIYPDRLIRAALLWTSGPVLMEIPAEKMDAALRALS
ncbi:double-strand break repair helicase AddA [Stappia sp. F7233]|uniref:DNA 3'-5' helicase n=1 Tax=Stappia albiluteola TaxID=2758565 RepID=A0A839AC22_9HYPH|nr:double-strand break repair helicase AddA [Stappia albiluteola]MBA5776991.1 double-strand break repair helicase AddA [Stappia albiluteola]